MNFAPPPLTADRPWAVRPIPRSEAIPSFVVESWLASYKRSPWAGVVPNNLYDAVHSDTIRQLVERGATIWVAHNPAKADHVIGYLCTEATSDGKPVVHYAFTKDYARRQGVCASLFEAAGIDPAQRFFYTFKTPASRYFRAGVYEPSIARRKAA